MSERHANVPWAITKLTATGVLAIVTLTTGFGFWAATAKLSGAIVVNGLLIQDQENAEIQHLSGGMVSEVLVVDGQKVNIGDNLIRLDATKVSHDLAINQNRKLELAARLVRLYAERDGSASLSFPPELTTASSLTPTSANILAGQIRLFETRQETWTQEQAAAANKIAQTRLQIEGFSAQIAALDRQRQLIEDQHIAQSQLFERGLIAIDIIRELDRETAVIEGKIGKLIAERAGASARISEIEIRNLSRISDRRENAISQIRDLEFQIKDVEERRRQLGGQLAEMTIAAPIQGVVFGLNSVGPSTVIEPAQVLMQIAPTDRPFSVRANIDPRFRDQIYPNQHVDFEFSGAGLADRGKIAGTVLRISAGTFRDPAAGSVYFQVDIELQAADLATVAGDTGLFPGMPLTVFINTGEDRAWVYLAKPFLRYFSRALRES